MWHLIQKNQNRFPWDQNTPNNTYKYNNILVKDIEREPLQIKKIFHSYIKTMYRRGAQNLHPLSTLSSSLNTDNKGQIINRLLPTVNMYI